MRISFNVSLLASFVGVAFCLSFNACTSSQHTPPPEPTRAEASAPAAVSSIPSEPSEPTPTSAFADYRDVIKMYRANISEDFILRQVRTERHVYNLSAEQVIELRKAGLSEYVIQAMLDSGRTAPIAEDVVSVPLSGIPPSAATLTAAAPSSLTSSVIWEGLVRHNPTLVSFRGKWDTGTLSFVDGEVRWVDAHDARKNLLLPEHILAEQFMTCLKKPGGNECFEWGFKTLRGEEYRFRDTAWEQGGNDKILAVHEYFRSRFPPLVDSSRPVDDK